MPVPFSANKGLAAPESLSPPHEEEEPYSRSHVSQASVWKSVLSGFLAAFPTVLLLFLFKSFSMSKVFSAALAMLVMTRSTSNWRVDTHHHVLPPMYLEAMEANGGEPTGYPMPSWSLEQSLSSMNKVGTSISILSLSVPGVAIAGTGIEARTLARDINDYFGNATTESNVSERLGFFGALPDWRDVNGTLAEIDYLYETQQLAHGVSASTSYGAQLLSHDDFAPIWQRLNDYHALVFVHPTSLPGEPGSIAGALPDPIVDFPLATTRAAVDLVLSGRFGQVPDVDVILSHAGGTLPYIGTRVIGSLAIPEVRSKVQVDILQAAAGFKRFYLDLALSSTPAQLNGLLDFTEPDKILFGSDFPYAAQYAIDALVLQYEAFVRSSPRGYKLTNDVLRRNALRLLQKHQQGKKFEERTAFEVVNDLV